MNGCAILQYYVASDGNMSPMFRDNVSVPSSKVKKSKKMGPIRCPETTVKDYHSTLRKAPEDRRAHQTSRRKPEVTGKGVRYLLATYHAVPPKLTYLIISCMSRPCTDKDSNPRTVPLSISACVKRLNSFCEGTNFFFLFFFPVA
jgi:hypothetical protein